MNLWNLSLVRILFVAALLVTPVSWAQVTTERTRSATSTSSEAEARKANVEAYIELMRRDVRQDRAKIVGSIMALSPADAAKFWPIYNDYEAQLNRLNDERADSVEEYARGYNQMTDQKADELMQKGMAYQKQRVALLASTYERVKQALGAVTAARFLEVENQLQQIIDLQIDSSLPVGGQGS
jgi:hypothetical protein